MNDLERNCVLLFSIFVHVIHKAAKQVIFNVVDWTATAAKCAKMKIVRAQEARLLFFIVKYRIGDVFVADFVVHLNVHARIATKPFKAPPFNACGTLHVITHQAGKISTSFPESSFTPGTRYKVLAKIKLDFYWL